MTLLAVAGLLLAIVAAANLILGRLPRPPADSGGVIETAHGPIHYVESVGEGPVIVFLHGMPSSCREFDLVRAALRGRHTIAFDRPGYAWSTGPPQDFGRQLDAVVEAATSLGVERAIVVGHSFGGLAALGMAIRHGGFVDRLLLLAPAAGGSRVAESSLREARLMLWFERPLVRQLADLLFLRLLRRHAARIGAAAVYGDADELALQRRIAESMLARHNSIRALANDRLLFNDAERLVTKNLGRISAPAIILHGESDPTVPTRNARRLADAMTAAELVEVAGDHHLPTKNVAEVVAALARLEAKSGLESGAPPR
jgi:pimeloyl-ACP methyl ester carboxylesterase